MTSSARIFSAQFLLLQYTHIRQLSELLHSRLQMDCAGIHQSRERQRGKTKSKERRNCCCCIFVYPWLLIQTNFDLQVFKFNFLSGQGVCKIIIKIFNDIVAENFLEILPYKVVCNLHHMNEPLIA